MRILSQENLYDMGNIDLPYEMCGLSMGYMGDMSKFFVFAHFQGADNKMAEYSSPQKARKAMEMLREECTFEKQFETICNGTTCYPSRPMYYFQFPQESEVEA